MMMMNNLFFSRGVQCKTAPLAKYLHSIYRFTQNKASPTFSSRKKYESSPQESRGKKKHQILQIVYNSEYKSLTSLILLALFPHIMHLNSSDLLFIMEKPVKDLGTLLKPFFGFCFPMKLHSFFIEISPNNQACKFTQFTHFHHSLAMLQFLLQTNRLWQMHTEWLLRPTDSNVSKLTPNREYLKDSGLSLKLELYPIKKTRRASRCSNPQEKHTINHLIK